MNTGIYRLIFNKRLGMQVPVAEVSAARGKGDGAAFSHGFTGARHASSPSPRLRLIAALLAAALGSPLAHANPANPTVVSGSASFSQAGNTLTVTNTPNAIINWGSFSIGQNELTRFVQQSSASAVLNRVTGQDPSQILGQLQSNGRVFLINPNGVLFGQGAKIDVAGLVASSLNLSNEDFLAGKMRFIGNGSEGTVKNAGDITTPGGGQIILIAPNVENSGVITSPNGEIILAAGHTVELADTLNPALRVEITAPEGEALNLGTLIAEGGQVGMYAGLVTQSGKVSATSAVAEGGRIFLKGTQSVTLAEGSVTEASGTQGGNIRVLADQQVNAHGTLTADGGGFIETSAATVNISGAQVSAGQGGTWLIDPTDVTIDAAAATSIVTTLNGGTDVTVQTTGTAGDGLGTGNITVSSAIAKTAGGDATLTLSAHNNIAVNANITSTSNKLNLNLNADSDATGGGSTTVSSGRTIDANGGTTSITGGLTLASGTLANTTLTTATGATASSTGSSVLDNVTLGTDLTIRSGNTLTIRNGLTLDNGSVTLASTGSQTYLNFAGTGNQQLAGNGEIVFGGTSIYNNVRASTAGGTLEIGSGITVHGIQGGTVGAAGFGLINHGTIDANTAGRVIEILGDNWSNDGTLKATAGVLDLNGTYSSPSLGTWFESGTGSFRFYGTLDNSGSTLSINDTTGSPDLYGTISGGKIEITGAATLWARSTAGILNGVTLSGNVTVPGSNTALTIQNGLTLNNGSVTLVDSSPYSTSEAYLLFAGTGNQQLMGMGEILFEGTSSGNFVRPSTMGGTLEIGSGITIHGTQGGTVGQTGFGLINHGIIRASSGTLTVSGTNWVNDGLFEVTNGTLNLGGTFLTASLGLFNRTGGTIQLTGEWDLSGTTLDLAATPIPGSWAAEGGGLSNGTLTSSDASKMLVSTSPSSSLDNITIGSDLATSGTWNIYNGLDLADGVLLSSGTSTYNFRTTGAQGINVLAKPDLSPGSATITLGGGAIETYSSDQTLTLGSGLTVNGRGSIRNYNNYSSNSHIINEGTIDASVAGQTLIIGDYHYSAGNTQFTNNGLIKASAGNLSSSANTFTNNGTILVNAGTTTLGGSSYTNLVNNTGSIVVNGGTLQFTPKETGATPTWDNNGTLDLQSGTVKFGGFFTPAEVGNFTRAAGTTVKFIGVADFGGMTLDLAGTDMATGNPFLGDWSLESATLKNATLTTSDATKILATTGTSSLDNVTIGSDLTTSGSWNIHNGLDLADGVTLTAGTSNYQFQGSGAQGINVLAKPDSSPGSATITLGGGVIEAYTSNQTLTLGSGLTVNGRGTIAAYYYAPNTHIVNEGTIDTSVAGQTLRVGLDNSANNAQFTNNGLIKATAGNLSSSANTFTNNGSILVNAGTTTLGGTATNLVNNTGSIVVNGGTLQFTPKETGTTPTWDNNGTLDLQSGTVKFGGFFTPAEVGNFTRAAGTTVKFIGVADFGGMTLDLAGTDMATGNPFLGDWSLESGTLKSATLTTSDATKILATTTASSLDNVTIGSDLSTGGSWNIYNGLDLADGVDFNVGSGALYFQSAASHIGLTAGATAATLTHTGSLYANAGNNSGTVTIDSGVTVQGSGALTNSNSSGGWVNNGTLLNNTTGTLNISPTNFTNNGTIRTTAGTLRFFLGWTNDGLIEIGAGSTVAMDSNAYNANGAYNGANLINNGVIRGTGTLDLGYASVWNGTAYTYTLHSLTNNGTLDPGVGAGGTGTLTVKGNLVQGAGGTLHLDLGGTGAGQYDKLSVMSMTQKSPTAQLGGTLEIAEGANGFFADLGDVFPSLVTTSGVLSGSFSSVSTPADVVFTLDQAASIGITNTAQSITRWGTDSSGDWGDAANWTRGVPTALKDTVVSRAGSTPTLTVSSGTHTAHSLQFDENLHVSGGTLTLPEGFATLGGNVAVSGGTLVLPSSFTDFNGLLDLSGGTLINPVDLSFSGTQTWTAGTVAGTGSITVAPSGVVNKDGAGLLDIKQAFHNAGQVNVGGGTLALGGGGSQSGSFDVSGGALLDLSGGHTLDGARFTSGDSGTVNLSGPLAMSGTVGIGSGVDFTLPANGSVTGGGVLDNQGTLRAAGVSLPATLLNSGTAYLNGGAVAGNVTNTGTLDLTGSVLFSGSNVLLSAGTVNLNSGAVLTKSGGFLNWAGGNIAGNGSLAFVNGGELTFSGNGDRVLDAPNITFAFTDLTLPDGSLSLRSGGLTFNGTTEVASTASLNLEGGTMTNNGPLNVSGLLGLYDGTLAGGGAISITGGTIDMPSGSTVNWTATGPMTNSGTLNLANQTITNPFTNLGTLNSGGGLSFTQLFTNQGAFNANAGTTTFSGGFNQTAGSLVLNGGSAAGDITLNGGVLGGSGTITGNVSILAGTLSPGFSPGSLAITGNLTLGPASSTLIELWGAPAGSGYDVISVGGVASLGGALNAGVGNGYVPAAGASHVFLSAGTLAGSYASSTLPAGFSLAGTGVALDLLNGLAASSPAPAPLAPPTMATLPLSVSTVVTDSATAVGLAGVDSATPALYAADGTLLALAAAEAGAVPDAGAATGSPFDLAALDAATMSRVNALFAQLIYDADTGEWDDENRLVCR